MEEKKKWYNIFGITKKEKTDAEEDIVGPLNIKNFFKLLKRRFSKLLTVNFLMLFEVVPVIAALFAMVWGPSVFSPDNKMLGALYGTMIASNSQLNSILYGVYGVNIRLPVYNTTIIITFAVIAVVMLLTFGLINVGTTYILRNMVRREPVFVWSDFWYAIKRNIKQGILFGILDLVFMAVLGFDVVYFYNLIGTSFSFDLMFYVVLIFAILYFVMRFYAYIILITFDLSIFKILKNSFIFAIIGFKRNIMAIIGILAMIIVNFLLFYLLMPLNIMFPMILPLFYLMGFGGFMAAYAAYPKIEEYMITPYQDENKEASD